jgi:hypothetical protein
MRNRKKSRGSLPSLKLSPRNHEEPQAKKDGELWLKLRFVLYHQVSYATTNRSIYCRRLITMTHHLTSELVVDLRPQLKKKIWMLSWRLKWKRKKRQRLPLA